MATARPRLIRARRAALVLVSVVLGLTLLIRLALDPIAEWQMEKTLAGLDGYGGAFRHIHVTLFDPGLVITDFKLWPQSRAAKERIVSGEIDAAGTAGTGTGTGAAPREPMVYVAKAYANLSFAQALRGRLLARARLEHPKLVVIPSAATAEIEPAKPAARAPDLSSALEKILGMKVDRVEIFDGELLFKEPSGPGVGGPPQELWVHRLELAAQNLATRSKLAGGRPATLAGHGTVGKSGELSLFVSADPFASPLSFAGQASVKGLAVAELYRFIEPKTGLNAPHGTIDVFAEFVSEGGRIDGGVKPLLKNIEIRPTGTGRWNRLKAWLADKTVELGSDRVGDRNAIATVIPIKGKLTDPDLQLWPTVLGVVRNAFVRGVTSGFDNLPPVTSPSRQGKIEQAAKALEAGAGPPKAEPDRSKRTGKSHAREANPS